MEADARKLVWSGAIPLQVQLHHSEVTTLPPPPPFLILAPRNGYFPFLIPLVKPQFQNALPIGQDTGWFEYRGLPLRWHFPIGVLFDLLCVEPERPWSLMVHFRGYPSELLPYDGEETMKWAFMNSLKEASYLMYGSTKNVMNLSQADQMDLWRSVMQGDLERYDRVCARWLHVSSQNMGRVAPTKLSFRLYVRVVQIEAEHVLEAPAVEKWDDIAYMTRPIDVCREDGSLLTLWDALVKIAPQLFARSLSETPTTGGRAPLALIWASEPASSKRSLRPRGGQWPIFQNGVLRIQGIEPSPDLPVNWIAQNLCAPDQFVHACVTIVSVNKRT